MDPRLLTLLVVALSVAQGAEPEEAKTSGEKRAVPESKTDSTGTKLNVRFTEDPKDLEKKAEDAVRPPRQSSGMFGQPPHTTTVCIQVRSEHQPQVLCGPQVDEKKDVPEARYRYAYPDYYSRASPPRYPQQFSPQAPMVPSAPPSPPLAPITVYPARPREEVLVPAPPPAPVAYQRLLYQPVVYPQASQMLRLNCGPQPEGGFLGSPLLRSGSSSALLGYYPVGEQMLLEGSPGPISSGQSVYSSSLRSRTFPGDPYTVQDAPYPYSSWSAGYYPADGFYPDAMRGRSVDLLSDYPDSNSLQEQELQQSRMRLRMLQSELKELHQRAAAGQTLGAIQGGDSKSQEAADQELKRQPNRGPGKRQAQAKA